MAGREDDGSFTPRRYTQGGPARIKGNIEPGWDSRAGWQSVRGLDKLPTSPRLTPRPMRGIRIGKDTIEFRAKEETP